MTDKSVKRTRRERRVRAKAKGGRSGPRLSVFRSNRHISAQLIDDGQRITIASASDLEINPKTKKSKGSDSRQRAEEVGRLIAERAKKKDVKKIAFDRGRYKYHGLVAALAEGARKGGLKF